mmetsp:Transcript_63940/g.151239  ORF Transcript_63940/g.151239 Transcript_63940/m.151239 type:complete len:189 (-) Transcript_63940:576-1142(-)
MARTSLSDTGVVLRDFLEVAIHSILFVREIYPADLFQRCRKYGVPVRQSRHPSLNQYIADAVESVSEWVKLGCLDKFVLEIRDSTGAVTERFVFSISTFDPAASVDVRALESTLRAFLLKINVSEAMLKTAPPDCTWGLLVHATGGTAPDTWVEDSDARLTFGAPVVPLKTSDVGAFRLNLFVEIPAN